MENDPTSFLQTPFQKIQDAANQLAHFKFLPTIEEAVEEIKKAKLVNLEEYTKCTREELEQSKPGICDAYNALVEKLKNPAVTLEEIKEVSKEVYKITR